MADHEKVYSVRFVTEQAEARLKGLEERVAKFEKTLLRVFGGANLSKAIDSFVAKTDRIEKKIVPGMARIDAAALQTRAQFEKAAGAVNGLGTAIDRTSRRGASGSESIKTGMAGIGAALSRARQIADNLDRSLGKATRDGSAGSRHVVAGLNAVAGAEDKARRSSEALDSILKRASKDGAAGMRDVGRAVKSAETAVRNTDEAISRMTRVKGEREKSRALREIEQRIKGIGTSSGIASVSITGLMARVSALIGIFRGIREIGSEFIGFDKSMVGASIRFDDTMRVGTDGYKNMRREVRAMAVEAGASVEAAAKSTEAWSKAGLNWKQTQKVMPVTLRAALAMDLPDAGAAGDLLSDALGQFHMRTDDTAQLEKNIKRVADVTLKAADISTLDPTQIFESFKTGAPMVTAMNESIEQLAADLVTLGNAGIKGSEAGTMIRSIYGAISAPRGPQQEKLKELGVEINDAAGNFRGLTTIIADLAKATQGMGTGEQTGILTRIFGHENISGFLNLLSKGSDEINKIAKDLENSGGSMDRVAEQMEKSVYKKWARFKSKLVDVGFSIIEQTDLFGRLGKAAESIDWNSVSKTITVTIIPALQKIGTIISDVVFPAIKNAAHLIESIFSPVIWLAEKAFDGTSKGGEGLAKVLGTLIALWATYRTATVAMMAVDLVRYFASLITKLGATAAAQTTLTAATNGTTAAMTGATAAGSGLLSKLGAIAAGAGIGWTIGTIIFEQVVDPLMKALHYSDELRDSLTESMKGPTDKLSKSVAENKKREALAEMWSLEVTGHKEKPKGSLVSDPEHDRYVALQNYVKRLDDQIATLKTRKNIEKYGIEASLKEEEQTSDIRDQSGVRVTDWQDTFEEGSFQAPGPLHVKGFADPQKQSFDYDDLFEISEQSVPTSYPIPKAFDIGKSFESPEDFYLEQSIPEGTKPTNYDAFDSMYQLQLQTADETRAFQDKMLASTLGVPGSTMSNKTVSQTINYTGSPITINAAGLNEQQLEKMMIRINRERDRDMAKHALSAADDAGNTEF